MLGVPENYIKNKRVDINTFIKKDMKVPEKKRLKETLKQVTLTHQIQGEEIPSLINDEYNCQVVMFLEVEIENIKDAAFVGSIIQDQIKALSVLNIKNKNTQVYYFAEKRLNMQDSQSIVLENTVKTKECSLLFDSETKSLLEGYLDFNNILLKENKLAFYRELMTKGFIISEYNFSLEGIKFLDSVIWYNSRKVKELLNLVKEIEKLKLLLKKSKNPEEKIETNKKLRGAYEKVTNLI